MIQVRIEKVRRSRSTNPVFAVFMLLLLGACGDPPGTPEQQLRAWVAKAEAHVESKERRDLLAMLSPSYADVRGNKADYVEDVLRVWFLRQNSIELLIAINEIRVFQGTVAEMEITVGMAGTNGGVLGFRADAYDFALELELSDGEWLLLSAEWTEMGG